MPVYNKAPWLPRVLEQIAVQRGRFAREYIFVDDGSTDDSLRVVNECTEAWPDVTIIEQTNHGPAHATNRGISSARMPYIKLYDADDLLADSATEILLAALQGHDAAVLAFGGAEGYEKEVNVYLSTDLSAAPVTVMERPLRAVLRNCPFIPSQCLIRTGPAQMCGGCDERVPFGQDYTLALRLATAGPFLSVGCSLVS